MRNGIIKISCLNKGNTQLIHSLTFDKTFANDYTNNMNTEKIQQLKKVAKRTLKILTLIEKGYTSNEVVEYSGANRQLVDYYFKVVKQK